jgi:hypothetical protein
VQRQHKKGNGGGEGTTGIEPETAIQTRDHGTPTPPANNVLLFDAELILND